MAEKENKSKENQPEQVISDEEAYRQALENIRNIPEPYQSAALSGNKEFFLDLEYPVLERKLHEKFRLDDIEWVIVHAYDYETRNNDHIIKAYAQPYIKKESAERRADIVFGAMNWRNDYNMPDSSGRFKYKLEFRKDAPDLADGEQNEWIPKIEGGSIDSAAKGGFSDKAFEVALSFAEKRAWSKAGIGRYLKLVPQIECRVSESWVEGWNRYSFRSKVKGSKDNPQYITIYWEEPNLPEWALHEEDKGKQKMQEAEPGQQQPQEPQQPGSKKNPQPMAANDAQWELMIHYYDNMPEKEKGKWQPYMFVEEVDDETGEVVDTNRRQLSADAASKIITSLEKGYGKLNENNVPEAFASKKEAENLTEEDLTAEDQEIKDMRDKANEKK